MTTQRARLRELYDDLIEIGVSDWNELAQKQDATGAQYLRLTGHDIELALVMRKEFSTLLDELDAMEAAEAERHDLKALVAMYQEIIDTLPSDQYVIALAKLAPKIVNPTNAEQKDAQPTSDG